MSQRAATVRVEVESKPQSVTLVRVVVAALAELFGFELELVNDLKTAISEACNNVVMHAYGGVPGPLIVQLAIDPEQVEAEVRDHGGGIQHAAPSEDRMGVGLAVITALATRAEFATPAEGGTRVRMQFARPGVPPGTSDQDRGAELLPPVRPPLAGDVVIALAPVSLLGEVLGRAARTMAAAASFSLERFSDVYLVADAIAAHARTAAGGGGIGFSIAVGERRLELALGPLRAGSGISLKPDVAHERMLSPLSSLVDELSVEPDNGTETLRLVLADTEA